MENVILAYNLTGECNLSCSYCAVKANENSTRPINPSVIKKGYDFVRLRHPDSFLEIFALAKGEPLLNWESINAIDSFLETDENSIGFVTTNGTLQEKVLDLVTRNRWAIQISYDGLDNNATRGKRQIVEDTIIKLVEAKASPMVRMTITPENIRNLKPSLDYLHERLGVEFVTFGPVVPLGKYEDKIEECRNLHLNKVAEAITYAKEKGMNPLLSIQEPCSLATRGYFFDFDGEPSICYIEHVDPDDDLRKRAEMQGCLKIDLSKLFI